MFIVMLTEYSFPYPAQTERRPVEDDVERPPDSVNFSLSFRKLVKLL